MSLCNTAMSICRYITYNQKNLNRNMLRLSSGYRINSAADDPAGLSVSESMRAQISGFTILQRNAQDEISSIQTADGALNEVHSMLNRMKELSVQSATGTYSDQDRENMNKEFTALRDEIDRITSTTAYNGKNRINDDSVSKKSGLSELNILTQENARKAADALDKETDRISGQRADLGAQQNALEHRINVMDAAIENLQAAESRIRDVDMAAEMVDMAKNKILVQCGEAMLAQANAQSKDILKVLESAGNDKAE